MSVITSGFKIGSFTLEKEYIMTTAEIQNLGDAEGYPDVFPIWNTDDGTFYIFYRTTDGTPNITNLEKITASTELPVLYPVVNSETNEIKWEIRTLTDSVPDPVFLKAEKGEPGKSAYQSWLDLGNVGTEQDFINSCIPDMSNLSEDQVSNLKNVLGLTEIEEGITSINESLDNIIGGE